MKLTAHFDTSEFEVDGDPIPPDLLGNARTVAAWLEAARAAGGDLPLHIGSGYRAPDANALASGAKRSDHMRMLAADFEPDGGQSKAWLIRAEAAGLPPFDQLIYYPLDGHIHVGLGERMRGQRFNAIGERKYTPVLSWRDDGAAAPLVVVLAILALLLLGWLL